MKIKCIPSLLLVSLTFFAGQTLCFAMDGEVVTALLKSTQPQNSAIAGTATFESAAEGLAIHVQVTGAPAGIHGIHIHEHGSCNNQGEEAGGHFNPDHKEHGNLSHDGFSKAHAGDLGNIEIAADGTGTLDVILPGLTVTGGKYAVTGRALMIHAAADDFGQPAGNAGGRIACGVI